VVSAFFAAQWRMFWRIFISSDGWRELG
jgi:hypothetical protein